MTIGILNILTHNTPCLYCYYRITFTFSEYNAETGKWKKFIESWECNNWGMKQIQDYDDYYSKVDYNWGISILKIEVK
jgi:hypothetical protein